MCRQHIDSKYAFKLLALKPKRNLMVTKQDIPGSFRTWFSMIREKVLLTEITDPSILEY